MSVRYLTMPEILWMHDESIKDYGGSFGIRDLGMLESAVIRPSMSVGQTDAFSTLSQKAAAYLDAFARTHPFIDGNKRISFLSSSRFLQLNSVSLSAEVDETEAFILAVITDRIDVIEIATWLDGRCVPLA